MVFSKTALLANFDVCLPVRLNFYDATNNRRLIFLYCRSLSIFTITRLAHLFLVFLWILDFKSINIIFFILISIMFQGLLSNDEDLIGLYLTKKRTEVCILYCIIPCLNVERLLSNWNINAIINDSSSQNRHLSVFVSFKIICWVKNDTNKIGFKVL